ncbi:MAG: diacylglycerol kinase family protein [Myxococcota bacterium]
MKRPSGWWAAFSVALEGIGSALQEQRHMRIHWLCTSAVLIVASGAGLSPSAQALLALCVAAVLGAELFNTALEAVVDLATPALHPLAKKAKDAAAGGVLVFSVGSFAVLVILLRAHWSRLDPVLVRTTTQFGLPFLLAQALLLRSGRPGLRGLAALVGAAALVWGWNGGGDRLYLALLGLLGLLTLRLTSGGARAPAHSHRS